MHRFQDHFSAGSADYAASRPRYPAALFRWLAAQTPGADLAVDLAAGNGQASEGLTTHFARVVAGEASVAQLAAGASRPRLDRVAALAEEIPLADRCADLVTVAQALHWLDLGRLWVEVARVLRPHGVVAVWCYDLLRIDPAVDRVIHGFYRDTVGPYWAPERRMVEEGYRNVAFPFAELPPPEVAMTVRWTLAEVGDYVATWSSTKTYRRRVGSDPVGPLLADLALVWGDPGRPRRVDFPLALRVGRQA